jgi:nitrogen fixation NifU-like protein
MLTNERRLTEHTDHLLTHADCPHHRGRLTAPSLTGHARNPYCGDLVRLDLAVDEGGRVREAWHDGRGCLVSRTAASLLCREIEGKTVTELRAMPAEAMLELLGLPLTPLRRVCALLPWSCLQSILRAADPSKAA